MGEKRWDELRDSLMRKTVKELRRFAKEERICLGYAASGKASMVDEIASQLRYREMEEGKL